MDIVNKVYEKEYRYNITNGQIPELDISAKNTEGMNGFIIYSDEFNERYAIHNDKYCVMRSYNMTKAKIFDYVEGNCETLKDFNNGDRVYFDVSKGTGCTMEEYASSYDSTISDYQNSLTGYNGLNGTNGQNGCLLFYAFNDNGSETVDLLLDHNVVDQDNWTASGMSSNKNGPLTVLSDLMGATNLWKGTITPEDYVVKQIVTGSDGTETIYGDYKIRYETNPSGFYKARLITANDIAKITGADIRINWDESKSGKLSYGSSYYFENLTENSAPACTDNNDATVCQYGWLYDRTSTTCENNGCYNNADARLTGYGYWTGTSALGHSNGVWLVSANGSLLLAYGTSNDGGVRPVITVSKSKISHGLAPIVP